MTAQQSQVPTATEPAGTESTGTAPTGTDPTGPGRVGPVARGDDRGMATAEYAIATVAAAGFAGLLIVILRSAEVRELLLGIVRGALSV